MVGAEVPTRRISLRYTGVFDLEGLFGVMQQWLKARRFQLQETTYKHRPGDEFGREEEIWWYCQRNLDSFVQYRVELYFHLWDLQNIEVVKDGKKKKMQKGRLELWMYGFVIADYQGHWERTRFHKLLREIYLKYILKPDYIVGSVWWDPLYYRIYKLHSLVKDYLNMHTKGYEFRRYLGDNI